jgi:hypothetical protein
MPPIIPSPAPVLTKRDMSATKEARDQAERSAVATLIASGTPIVITPLPIPTQGPVLTPVLGITGDCAQGDNVFDYGGCWVGRTDTEYTFVSTGAFWDDLPQGIIRVYTSTLDLQDYGPQHSYQAPSRSGLLHVAAAEGFRLTLEAADGTRFYFDVATRQWVYPARLSNTPPDSTLPPSTPVVVAVPSQVAGIGIIYNTDQVGIGVALDLPSQLGSFVNEWDAQINGQYIQVFAGTKSSPAESERAKGVVVIRITDRHYNTLDLVAYEPPLARGVVRVVDAVGERLTLQAADGTLFYFDVPTRQWVNP